MFSVLLSFLLLLLVIAPFHPPSYPLCRFANCSHILAPSLKLLHLSCPFQLILR